MYILLLKRLFALFCITNFVLIIFPFEQKYSEMGGSRLSDIIVQKSDLPPFYN